VGFGIGRSNQTRGIYGLRRDEESTKTIEIKAAATGAIIALVMALFKLWWSIFIAFVIFKSGCKFIALI